MQLILPFFFQGMDPRNLITIQKMRPHHQRRRRVVGGGGLEEEEEYGNAKRKDTTDVEAAKQPPKR